MRIWWQSFVDAKLNAAYMARLAEYLGAQAPEADITVAGISPPDRWFSRLTELRCGVIAVDNALEAAARGYDVFVVGHFQEPCLAEAQASAGIHVVGLGEASLRRAAATGRSLALVSIDPVFVDYHWEQVERYGLRDSVAGIVGLGVRVEDFAPAFSGDADAYARLVGDFERVVAPLVDAGADVVVPAGGLFGLLTAHEQDFRVGDAVVVNCISAALDAARVAAAAPPPARQAPPQAIEEFRAFVSAGVRATR